MLKKMSLRTRLTLLSAIVITSTAVVMTVVSILSADYIFVRGVQKMFGSVTISQKVTEFSAGDGITFTPSDDNVDGRPVKDADYMVLDLTLSEAGRRFNLWGITGMLLITLLGIGAAWLMAGRALMPVRELSRTIEEINGKDLTRRVDTHGSQDEIGRLAGSFNTMMDKVSESFERQKRFSASAAHELRTPLTTIQLGVEVLELDKEPDPERMKKALAVTKSNTDRMIRLVGDLFRLSTDEAYEMDEEMTIHSLFSDILEELFPMVQAAGLKTSVSASPEITLSGNRILLYRALFNLTENAVKYNREGGFVFLSAWKEGEEVMVSIRDSGIGISSKELPHIFEPFYRVDRSRSRAMGGSGLGLSLVKEIIEKHGGTIGVISEPGEGTLFTICFPAAQVRQDEDKKNGI